MKTCDEFQLAIEMQQHGALEVESGNEAQAHVAGCSTCQRELAQLAEVDSALKVTPGAPLSRYSEVAQALGRDRFWSKYLPWIALGSFVGQGALLALLISPEAPLKVWGTLSAAGVVFAAAATLDVRRKRRSTLEAARLGVEAWARHRRAQLKADQSDLRKMMWILPGMGLLMVAGAVVMEQRLGQWLLGGTAAAVVGLMIYFAAVTGPRLRRERAELGEAS